MRIDPASFAAALAYERGFVCVGGDVLAVPLPFGKQRQRTDRYMLISREDRHLTVYKWSLDGCGYPRRRLPGPKKVTKTSRVSREIFELVEGDGVIVDHINRDKLDNRRENLRLCTHAENCQNTGSRGGTSKYRGVCRQPHLAKEWMAFGTIDGKMKCMGYFKTEDEAYAARLVWQREHMPFATD